MNFLSRSFVTLGILVIVAAVADSFAPPPWNLLTQFREYNVRAACESSPRAREFINNSFYAQIRLHRTGESECDRLTKLAKGK